MMALHRSILFGSRASIAMLFVASLAVGLVNDVGMPAMMRRSQPR